MKGCECRSASHGPSCPMLAPGPHEDVPVSGPPRGPSRKPTESLKAPFPWFGGKSRAAAAIWEGLGDVANYVEPFAGSLAVLLGRPTPARTETVNDLDCYVSNFWRATQSDPEALAAAADWPVNEADLHARHRWLVGQSGFRERMKAEPEFYDVRVAGWWAWGLCSWIGTGWCDSRERGNGPSQQIPHLGDAGMGLHRKLPHLGDAGRGLFECFSVLSDRLRRVRVSCGDWTRVMGESVTVKHGLTGVVLDPPYDDGAVDYAAGSRVSSDVRAWAIENGENPLLRIALCGYDGEHDMPPSWRVHEWKAKGGYASQGDGSNVNAARERVWFSPACLGSKQGSLFSGGSS